MKEYFGKFDGQHMADLDGKLYPVPANYASKSMLLEGDGLKLTINQDGAFIYKQAYPQPYKRLIGRVFAVNEDGGWVDAGGKEYRVLLASATYHKLLPGTEVTLRIPATGMVSWAAVENVIQCISQK